MSLIKRAYSNATFQIMVFVLSMSFFVTMTVVRPIFYTHSSVVFITSLIVLAAISASVWQVLLVFAGVLLSSRLLVGRIGSPPNYEIISSQPVRDTILVTAFFVCVAVAVRNFLLWVLDKEKD